MNQPTESKAGAPRKLRGGTSPLLIAIIAAGTLAASGCSSVFNPAFVALVTTPSVDQTTGTVPSITIDNASGHVPVVFINNTTFAPRLLNYLAGLGLDTTGANLRPRIRLRTDIRYVTGTIATIEFIDGSSVIQTSVQTEEGVEQVGIVPTDLIENDLTNIVAVCDVQAVSPGVTLDTNAIVIEVFVPVFLKEIRIVEQDIVIRRELSQTIQPQFTVLEPDMVDANNNVVAIANFDIRDTPVPATNIQCGSVVGFTISGELSVPFVQDELNQIVPGFLDTDENSQLALPGRYEFVTSLR